MSQTLSEKLTSTPEGLALYQQEGLILEVTELICGLMNEQGVSRADLAGRLGKSRAHVTQLLDGRANMTLRTVSDVLTALGASLRATAVPIGAVFAAPGPELDPVVLTYFAPDPADGSIEITTTDAAAPCKGTKRRGISPSRGRRGSD